MNIKTTNIISDLVKELGLNKASSAFLISAINFVSSEKKSKNDKQTLTTMTNLLDLQEVSGSSEDDKRNISNLTYSIKMITDLGSLETKSYSDFKQKTRGIKALVRAASEVTRNLDKTVSFVLCSTNSQRELAYIASNIEGILESIKTSLDRSMNSSGTQKDMIELVETHHKLTNQLTDSTEKLSTLVNDSLKNGYGSREQQERYTSTIIEDNMEKITTDIISGKSLEEIAKELKVIPRNFISNLNKAGLKNKLVLDKKEFITTKIKENVEHSKILEELNFHEEFLNETSLRTYINQWKKAEKVQSAAKTKKQKNNNYSKKVNEAKKINQSKVKTTTKKVEKKENEDKTINKIEINAKEDEDKTISA